MTEGKAKQIYVKDETVPPLCMNGTVAAIISRLNTFVSVSFGPVDLFTLSFGPSPTNGIYFILVALLFFKILLGGIADMEIKAWNTFLQSIYVLHMDPGCRRNLSNYRSEVEWARVLRVLSKTFVSLSGLNITLEQKLGFGYLLFPSISRFSFAQSRAFLKAPAPCRKESGLSVTAEEFSWVMRYSIGF